MRYILVLVAMFAGSLARAGSIPVYDGNVSNIGVGVNSMAGKMLGRCLEGSIEDGPANQTFAFQTIMSESAEDILERERGYGSAAVDFWIVGAKARTEFLLRQAETKTQSSLLWKFAYQGGTKVFRKQTPNALGLSLLMDSPGRTCGDSFISGASVGARLWLSVNLIFQSAEQYQFYKSKVTASALGGMLKKSKTSLKEIQDLAKGAYLSIQSYQYGGESFDLDVINASLPSVCPLESVDLCLDRFAAIQSYALRPDGFRAAVQSASRDQWKVLFYSVSSYADSGLRALGLGAMESDEGLRAISEALFDKSREIQQQLAFAKASLTDGSKSSAELDQVQSEISGLEQQAASIRNAVDICQNESAGACQAQDQLVKLRKGFPL